jgi:hypothetical protein
MSTLKHLKAARAVAMAALALGAAAAAQAQVVVRDAETGAFRPATAAEAAALASQKSSGKTGPRGLLTGTASPRAVARADGSLELEHDESMLNYAVVTRTADGRLVQRCVPNAKVAELVASGRKTAFAKNMMEIANER